MQKQYVVVIIALMLAAQSCNRKKGGSFVKHCDSCDIILGCTGRLGRDSNSCISGCSDHRIHTHFVPARTVNLGRSNLRVTALARKRVLIRRIPVAK